MLPQVEGLGRPTVHVAGDAVELHAVTRLGAEEAGAMRGPVCPVPAHISHELPLPFVEGVARNEVRLVGAEGECGGGQRCGNKGPHGLHLRRVAAAMAGLVLPGPLYCREMVGRRVISRGSPTGHLP